MEENKPKTNIPSSDDPKVPPQMGVDPRSLILPNRAVHDPLNAIRANAGTLVQSESAAVLPKTPAPPPLPTPARVSTDAVVPLETYQTDVEQYVRKQNVSAVSVATAEENRRQSTGQSIEVMHATKSSGSRATAIIAGVVLVALGVGGSIFAYLYSRPLAQAPNPVASYIAVDSVQDITFQPGDSNRTILNVLQTAKNSTRLSVGLIAQLRPWLSSTTGQVEYSAAPFLSAMVSRIPPQLLRALQPQFLLGVHSFDTNQPFLIMSVDTYQSGYAGMLEWESTMREDLSPLFDYTPSVHSTNPLTQVTPPSTSTSTVQVLVSPFTDAIVDNHDARVIKNSFGDILLLWTFLDRTTILITTNPNTVLEVVARLKNAPHLTVP